MFFPLPRLLLAFACALLSTVLHAAPPGAPTRLRVNDVASPVGTGADLYFGWLVNDPDRDELQSACQIRVASSADTLSSGEAVVWDSGRVASRLQNHVAYAGPALRADTRYHWQVRTWDKDGAAGPWSAPAAFTVGLLADRDWEGAQWIRRDSTDADDYTRFRRRFDLPAGRPVLRATLYLSAVHQYALHVNGALVAKGQPYHYPQYQYYQAHDVTPLLRAGEANQLAILTHWFGGGQGRPASARGLIAKLVVHHADGSVTTLGTGADWKQSRAEAWVLADLVHRNRGEGVGYVERIDSRLLDPAWTTLAYDDAAWSPASVVGPHPVAPWTGRLAPDLTRVVERVIAPASIVPKGGGKYVVDLGRVWAGMPRIRFSGGAPGQTIALVGHTGSGKSTIINLLAKFYPATSGDILIDGHELRNVSARSIRRQLGIVHQTNFLFTGTVLENIRFGLPHASNDDIAEAARRLDCLDLLEGLPQALETQVGEGGSSLSLGQRQLVCFTRALLANPRILILDEATSAVDPATEARLQRALARLLAGRTSFVVAHRLSTIVRADQILVLNQGRIVERGTHRDLLAARGKYHALYREFVFAGLAGEENAPAPAIA